MKKSKIFSGGRWSDLGGRADLRNFAMGVLI